jgi:hypothetical protein
MRTIVRPTNRERIEELEQEIAWFRQAYFELLSIIGAHPDFNGPVRTMVEKWNHFGCNPQAKESE